MSLGGMEDIVLDLYRPSGGAWARLKSHLPHNQPGRPRVDDQRVISGILHILKTGAHWRESRPNTAPPATTGWP